MSFRRPSALSLAFSWPVVRRALGYAVVVGFILASINHGDCFVSGHFGMDGCFTKSLLTACVPYLVSTLSSVQALMSAAADCPIQSEAEDTQPSRQI